uniref:Uncharacterized protein n=1 Tax=Caenorhabditis japonica TaxID=281687 RepID=A0A8R1EUY1_CAEJA
MMRLFFGRRKERGVVRTFAGKTQTRGVQAESFKCVVVVVVVIVPSDGPVSLLYPSLSLSVRFSRFFSSGLSFATGGSQSDLSFFFFFSRRLVAPLIPKRSSFPYIFNISSVRKTSFFNSSAQPFQQKIRLRTTRELKKLGSATFFDYLHRAATKASALQWIQCFVNFIFIRVF